MITKEHFDLSNYALKVFSENVFLSSMSRYFTKRVDNKLRAFAGVTYDPRRKQYVVYYNSDMLLYAQKNMEEKKFELFVRDLITHEMLHPGQGHFKESRELVKKQNDLKERFKDMKGSERLRAKAEFRKINVAMDLTINHYLREGLDQDIPVVPSKSNPEGKIRCCFPEQFGVPEGMTSQWYYENIKDAGADAMNEAADRLEKMEKDGTIDKMIEDLMEAGDTLDDHSGMTVDSDGGSPSGNGSGEQNGSGDGEGGDAEEFDSSWADSILKETVQQSILKARRAPGNKQFGNMPASLIRDLNKLAGFAQIDWKTYFSYFCRGKSRGEKRKCNSIINRRYPEMFAGSVRIRRPRIAVAYDQSGSVSDQMLSALDVQIQSLSALVDFTIIPFDCTVDEDNITEHKKGHIYKLERTRSGGTNFDAPTDWVNQNAQKFDGFIIATDMCAPQPGPSLVPRLWLTIEGCNGSCGWTPTEVLIEISPEDMK